ncbi:MAG: LytR C-terminal domain-containing protein [Promicromonosporaceae bacterium]|nr:LytR C-terminal domain-containing protein [Promicromonosporaceae bacterium]
MSRSQYPYPPDEFDVRGPDDSPVGVHRAPRSRWSSVWPFLLVAVIAIAVAVGGVHFLSNSGGGTADATGTTQSAPPTDKASTPAADASPSPTDAATEQPAAPTTPAAPDLSTLIAAANTGANIRVLNDGGPAGEAAKGQAALKAKGFTNATATNWPGGASPQVTSVWFNAGKSDTAAAVAAVLGIPSSNVSQQTLRQGDVVVIIKSALTPAG